MDILTVIGFFIFFVFTNLLPGSFLVFYATKEIGHLNFWDRLILSLLVSPFVLVLVSFVEYSIGIPQNGFILLASLIMIAGANILFMKKHLNDINLRFNKPDKIMSLVYLLFLGVLVSRLLPTAFSYTPLLHDPIAHSEWLKYLNINHFPTTKNWYPQGLELYLNYFVSFFNLTYPKSVLVATNYFTALFSISMFYLGYLLLKPKSKSFYVLPLLLFFVASLSPFPNAFYYTAGKNSMIVAFAITPLILYLIEKVKSRFDYIFLTLLLFSVFIVHYPSGIFLYFIFYLKALSNCIDLRAKPFIENLKDLRLLLISTLISVFLGILLLIKAVPIYLSLPQTTDKSIEGVVLFIKTTGIIHYTYRDFFGYIVSSFGFTTILIFIMGVAIVFANKSAEDKDLKKLIFHNTYFFIVLSLLGALLLIPKGKTLGIFFSFELRFFFTFILILVISWFANFLLSDLLSRIRFKKKNIKYNLLVLPIALLFLLFCAKNYIIYIKKQNALMTVSKKDIEAFQFIDKNLSKDKKVLIQMAKGGNVVMGSDSGVWIPSYTSKQIELGFAEYNKPDAESIYQDYMAISKNPFDQSKIKEAYCQYNIGYIFFGSKPVFANNMNKEKIEKSMFFEKIYDDQSSLFKVRPVDCD